MEALRIWMNLSEVDVAFMCVSFSCVVVSGQSSSVAVEAAAIPERFLGLVTAGSRLPWLPAKRPGVKHAQWCDLFVLSALIPAARCDAQGGSNRVRQVHFADALVPGETLGLPRQGLCRTGSAASSHGPPTARRCQVFPTWNNLAMALSAQLSSIQFTLRVARSWSQRTSLLFGVRVSKGCGFPLEMGSFVRLSCQRLISPCPSAKDVAAAPL